LCTINVECACIAVETFSPSVVLEPLSSGEIFKAGAAKKEVQAQTDADVAKKKVPAESDGGQVKKGKKITVGAIKKAPTEADGGEINKAEKKMAGGVKKKPPAADVTGLPAAVDRAKHPKKPKFVDRKKPSDKSGNESYVTQKSDDAGSLVNMQGEASSVSPANLMEAKLTANANQNFPAKIEDVVASIEEEVSFRASSATHDGVSAKHKRKAGGNAVEWHAHVNAEDSSEGKHEDLPGMPPVKSQKVQPSLSTAESSETVTPMSQQMNNGFEIGGGIPKRGRAAVRRGYANVGNRVQVPGSADAWHLVPGDGFPAMRGGRRGRPRGGGSTGFIGIRRGMAGMPAGPSCGARGATSARGVLQHGMPVGGRGRMRPVASLNHHSSAEMMSNGAASVQNVPNTAGLNHGKCINLCTQYFILSLTVMSQRKGRQLPNLNFFAVVQLLENLFCPKMQNLGLETVFLGKFWEKGAK